LFLYSGDENESEEILKEFWGGYLCRQNELPKTQRRFHYEKLNNL
jgi:hypothetical protein